jgi:hypothetical protein
MDIHFYRCDGRRCTGHVMHVAVAGPESSRSRGQMKGPSGEQKLFKFFCSVPASPHPLAPWHLNRHCGTVRRLCEMENLRLLFSFETATRVARR